MSATTAGFACTRTRLLEFGEQPSAAVKDEIAVCALNRQYDPGSVAAMPALYVGSAIAHSTSVGVVVSVGGFAEVDGSAGAELLALHV